MASFVEAYLNSSSFNFVNSLSSLLSLSISRKLYIHRYSFHHGISLEERGEKKGRFEENNIQCAHNYSVDCSNFVIQEASGWAGGFEWRQLHDTHKINSEALGGLVSFFDKMVIKIQVLFHSKNSNLF